MNVDRVSELLGDIEIEGTIRFRGHLTFGGQLGNGNIVGEDLVVGPTAVVEGNISVTSLILHGSVTGEVTVAGRCEIKSTASLVGSLVTSRLTMHDGATLIGGVVVEGGSAKRPAS